METERDREILEQLAEYGMEVAAALKAQIETASDADCADRLSLAFTRVSRSIRQTLAFKAKLADLKAKSAEKRQTKDREQAIENVTAPRQEAPGRPRCRPDGGSLCGIGESADRSP